MGAREEAREGRKRKLSSHTHTQPDLLILLLHSNPFLDDAKRSVELCQIASGDA